MANTLKPINVAPYDTGLMLWRDGIPYRNKYFLSKTKTRHGVVWGKYIIKDSELDRVDEENVNPTHFTLWPEVKVNTWDNYMGESDYGHEFTDGEYGFTYVSRSCSVSVVSINKEQREINLALRDFLNNQYPHTDK